MTRKVSRAATQQRTETMEANLTVTDVPPQWSSQPMYHLPPWGEPLVRSQGGVKDQRALKLTQTRLYCLYYAAPCSLLDGETSPFSTVVEKLAIMTPILIRMIPPAPQTTFYGTIRTTTMMLKTLSRPRNISPNGGHAVVVLSIHLILPDLPITYIVASYKNSLFSLKCSIGL